MYSKAYWITVDPGQAESLMNYYDTTITPAIKESDKHVGHHMIESGDNKWLLVSNYVSKEAAEAAASMVQKLIKPMVEQMGMTLVVITEGEVSRSI